VDCGALTPTLIQSELFGHERGAFTGADRRRVGAFEEANGGTLFLDEVGELPPAVQATLLGALERRRFKRVGGSAEVAIDVRVVSATNRELRADVNSGAFRLDLFYRLAVTVLTLPPLRERPEDIDQLARHFLREAGNDFGREVVDFEPAALDALRAHNWPGNVRELMSMVRRAVVIGDAPVVSVADLVGLGDTGGAGGPVYMAPAKPLPRPGSHEERTALLDALSRTQENVTLTAQELGVSRVTLYRMLRRHSINLSRGLKEPPVPSRGKPFDQPLDPASDVTMG
jgi:DNA-binding NtrC family response regulator